MGKTVRLKNGDFALPAYHTGVEVLFLLAEAINEVFSAKGVIDILDSSEQGDWIGLLRLLGQLSVDPQTRVGDISQIKNLWAIFFLHNDVKNLEPQILAIFEEVGDRCIFRAAVGRQTESYLDGANDSGHSIVRKILKKHSVVGLLPSAPVPVEVFYDGPGQMYCAGSHLWTNRIRLAYQPVPHALMGAIIADLVFAHEYFSHFVPKNKHLDATIREQWLVAALRGAMEDDRLVPYWKSRLWTPYRTALESHVTALAKIVQPDASVVRYSGLQGAAENLRVLDIRNGPAFWRLTAQILRSRSDPEVVDKASQIARHLAHGGVPPLTSSKVLNINDLYEILGL